MIIHLQRSLRKSKTGVATIFGILFFILILAILLPSMLLILQQNQEVEQVVIKNRQMDLDRADEQLEIINPVLQSSSNTLVTLSCLINNTSPLVIQIVRLWVADNTNQQYGNLSLSIPLQQGETQAFNRTLELANNATDNFSFWFVTARGNNLPLTYPSQIINNTQINYNTGGVGLGQMIASVTGSIINYYKNFSFYQKSSQYTNGETLGTGYSDYSIPNSDDMYTIFHVLLINLDPSNETIYLKSDSCLWDLTPHSSTVKSDYWPICNVTNGKYYTSLTEIALPFNQTVSVYFGPEQAKYTVGYVVPMGMLLWGNIGGSDYGQNIPFIALKMEP